MNSDRISVPGQKLILYDAAFESLGQQMPIDWLRYTLRMLLLLLENVEKIGLAVSISGDRFDCLHQRSLGQLSLPSLRGSGGNSVFVKTW